MPDSHFAALLTIGDVARRTGLSVSAIRFYEDKGLVHPVRSAGGQRRFLRADIRRLSFLLIAQQMGLTIADIVDALADLPKDEAPSKSDWSRIATAVQGLIDERIAMLERTREQLTGCIGCGCLSLNACALYNPQDRAGNLGTGPQHVLKSPLARR